MSFIWILNALIHGFAKVTLSMMRNLIYNYPCLQLNKHIYVNKWSSNIDETRFSGGAYYRSLKYASSMEWYRHFQHDWCLRLFRLKTRSFFATLKQRRSVRVNPSLYLNWRPLPFQQEMLQHSEYVLHLKMTKKNLSVLFLVNKQFYYTSTKKE